MVTPFATAPGQGDRFVFLGHDFAELATGARTGGAFGLHEIVQRRGGEPPLHVHRREDEAFYLLEGRMTFFVGDRELAAEPGTLVFCPRGVPHSFTVDTDEARLLQLCAPGGLEAFFSSWRERPFDPEAMAAAMAEYGVEIVGPPPGR